MNTNNININKLDIFNCTFFLCNIDIIKNFLSVQSGFILGYSCEIDYIHNENYEYNPKASEKPMRAVFFSLSENKTVMFSNLRDGWSTLVNIISSSLKIDSLYCRIMSDKFDEPCNYITCYQCGVAVRTVYTLKERTKWIFYETGKTLSFENSEYYKAKLKKSRLNKNIIIEYLDGLNLTNSGILSFVNEDNFSVKLS